MLVFKLVDTHLDFHLLAISLLSVLSVQNCTPVLVQLDRSDNDVAGVDANGSRGTVGLVTLYPVNVDHPFFTVNLGDFAFPALEFASYDSYFVVFTDGKRTGLLTRK